MEMQKKAADRLAEDLAAIYIGNLNTVEADLDLPLKGENGSAFVWETGESRFISPEGKVYRPLHGMGNRKVHLTVTGTLEGETAVREFDATVLQEPRENIVKTIRPVEITGEPGIIPELPSVVIVTCEDGRTMTMPVSWEVTPTIPDEGEMRIFGSLAETKMRPVAVIRPEKPEETDKEDTPKLSCRYFPMQEIQLTEGSWYWEAQQRMNEYLLSLDIDQHLYNFRKACGLPTKDAPPMTGWDEDSCKLKGHTTGHALSGLALAFAATGDERFRKKVREMVDGLAECQEAFAKGGKVKEGFLSAYDEEQFDLLEQFTKYPEIWAPYYTLDKIMSGLYDAYTLAGNEKALEIETKMGDWVYARLSRLPQSTLNKMWSMYIAGEFGGMIGTMARLYGLTGKAEHLEAARLFHNEKLFYPMEEGVDTLEDMHANQHIPQIIGAMEMYAATGEQTWWKIGSHFWDIATKRHAYCVGGVGETEMFHAPNSTTRFLTDKAAESCASYNLLRLTGQLFAYDPEGGRMDYYENTLLNHILTSCSHTADGGTTYFLPLGPGGQKTYSTVENTCCHGTGMESRYRFMEHIYAQDEEAVYVNLPVPSRLSGEYDLDVEVSEEGLLTVRTGRTLEKKLRLHIPAWAKDGCTVSLNGSRIPVCECGCGGDTGSDSAAGKEASLSAVRWHKGYLELPAGLAAGDAVSVQLPMGIRELDNSSDNSFANLAYGPYILAELSDDKGFRTLPKKDVIRRTGGELLFEADGRKMIPLARVDKENYHTYWKR